MDTCIYIYINTYIVVCARVCVCVCTCEHGRERDNVCDKVSLNGIVTIE